MDRIIIIQNTHGACAVYINGFLSALTPHPTDPYMIRDTLTALGINSKVIVSVRVQKWPDRFERLEMLSYSQPK